MLSFPLRNVPRAHAAAAVVGSAGAALNASSSSQCASAAPPSYVSVPVYYQPSLPVPTSESVPTPHLAHKPSSARLPPPPVPPPGSRVSTIPAIPASIPVFGPPATSGKPTPTVWRVVNASCKKLQALGHGHDERGMAKRLLCRQMLENVQQMSREHQQRRRDQAANAAGADSSLTRRTSTGSCDHLMAAQPLPQGPHQPHLGVSLHDIASDGDTDTESDVGQPTSPSVLPPRRRTKTTPRSLFRRKSPPQPPTIMFNSSA